MSIVDIPKDVVTTLGGTYTADDDTVSELLARIDAAFASTGGSLPAVTTEDNGDLLGVSGGKWAKVDPPAAELPAVTADDNGDLLGVSSGAWGKVDPPTEIIYVPFTVTEDQGTYTATTEANYLDAKTAALAGKSVVARCTGLASSIVDVPLEAVATDGTSIHFSRVIYLGTAVLFFWASWTPTGVSLTVKQITAT